MQRLLMEELKKWKDRADRKPLVLKGARQVGKTWLMKAFGEECYERTAYVSFFNNRAAANLFRQDYDAGRIISELQVLTRTVIEPQNTLIIFDEVQEAPNVIESLKYFCEEAPEYHIIAAGSLLGVALHSGVSYPVGKVQELQLYPMNFREFLMALGEQELADAARNYRSPAVSDLRDRYNMYLKQYLAVGGMPEAVGSFSEHHDYIAVREIQNNIVLQYEGDFGKHASPSELPRIRMTWNSIPMQLAKENKKFFFGQIKKGARMAEFEVAIQWLCDAGLVYKVNKVTKPEMPLKAYIDNSAFKLFAVDVGLLGALSELDIASITGGNSIYVEFKGALAEQYVLQELLASGRFRPYYYAGEKSTYEVDLLVQKDGMAVPVEVKAEDNLRARSLKAYCEKFKPEYAVRTSTAPMREQDRMVNIPLWAVASL